MSKKVFFNLYHILMYQLKEELSLILLEYCGIMLIGLQTAIMMRNSGITTVGCWSSSGFDFSTAELIIKRDSLYVLDFRVSHHMSDLLSSLRFMHTKLLQN